MSFYSNKVLELYEDFDLEFILESEITNKRNIFNIKGQSVPCNIFVFDNEGDYIPHFHFRFEKHGKIIEGCIKIMNAEYFIHSNHTGKLNNKEAQALNYWLGSPSDDKNYNTNWLKIVGKWNEIRDNKYKLPDPKDPKNLSLLKQPDYTMLNY